MPRLAIGLPVYNGERHLAEAIESILGQSFGDFVLLVGDNASTDGTQDIVQRYAAHDPRVQLHRQASNTGLVANHNRLFAMADCPLFKWAAADDAMEPACIERCVAELDANPDVVLAYARTKFVDCDGAVLDKRDPGWDLREPDAAARLRRVVMGGALDECAARRGPQRRPPPHPPVPRHP
jgi:glycosyltransferase involved in cell wall biosynthesis